MSDKQTTLRKALLGVQRQITAIKKDSSNPHFKNTYTSLEKVLEVVKPLLNDAGILFMQLVSAPPFEGHAALATVFIHADSGEEISSLAVFPLQKSDPQGASAANTYMRRVSLLSALGIPEEDDDAESAVVHGSKSAPVKPRTSLFPTRKAG